MNKEIIPLSLLIFLISFVVYYLPVLFGPGYAPNYIDAQDHTLSMLIIVKNPTLAFKMMTGIKDYNLPSGRLLVLNISPPLLYLIGASFSFLPIASSDIGFFTVSLMLSISMVELFLILNKESKRTFLSFLIILLLSVNSIFIAGLANGLYTLSSSLLFFIPAIYFLSKSNLKFFALFSFLLGLTSIYFLIPVAFALFYMLYDKKFRKDLYSFVVKNLIFLVPMVLILGFYTLRIFYVYPFDVRLASIENNVNAANDFGYHPIRLLLGIFPFVFFIIPSFISKNKFNRLLLVSSLAFFIPLFSFIPLPLGIGEHIAKLIEIIPAVTISSSIFILPMIKSPEYLFLLLAFVMMYLIIIYPPISNYRLADNKRISITLEDLR